ncbi:hypothetical protein VIBNISO65_560007 [Vibrio nigripulchritudo SO65]|nr:hypothetical protein VIBNISO65_560007 [Vibrio nigripulchritudo SO65]
MATTSAASLPLSKLVYKRAVLTALLCSIGYITSRKNKSI